MSLSGQKFLGNKYLLSSSKVQLVQPKTLGFFPPLLWGQERKGRQHMIYPGFLLTTLTERHNKNQINFNFNKLQ